MDVRFCEGRNPRREARVRTVSSRGFVLRALPSAPGEVRVPLDKDLHGSRHLVEVAERMNFSSRLCFSQLPNYRSPFLNYVPSSRSL